MFLFHCAVLQSQISVFIVHLASKVILIWIRNKITLELEQNRKLLPAHSPLDRVGAAVGQGTSRLDINEASEI